MEVVYRRLVSAGLGEFCLELHSTKANKRAVMNEIRLSLDASLQGVAAVPQASSNRLPVVRQELTDYTNAVHAPDGTLNQSPYHAYGELGAVLHAPKVVLQNDIFKYTQEQINDALREVKDLSVAAEHTGALTKHAWRDTTKTFYAEHDFDQIENTGQNLKQKLDEAIAQAQRIENSFGLPPIKNFADVEAAIAIASVMARSPGAPAQVLANEAWNTPPAEAKNLIDRGRRTVELKERIAQRFTPDVLDQNPTEDIAYIEQKSSGFFSFLAFLDSRYRAIKSVGFSFVCRHIKRV